MTTKVTKCNFLPNEVGFDYGVFTHGFLSGDPERLEDTLKGNWKQFKGKMIEQWGKLTNDDFDVIDGKREQFLGKLQERQGIARDAAEKQLKEWQERHPDFRFND